MALVALCAGMIRGFTGFGGPAFMLAILTIFFTPLAILAKVMVIDLCANVYLFWTNRGRINWRLAGLIIVPSLLALPVGHWLLLELDAQVTKKAIAAIIAVSSLAMLLGFRYRRALPAPALVAAGVVAGVVYGGTYIALLVVVLILLGPYDRSEARAIIIGWAFFVAAGFGVVSMVAGTVTLDDVSIALPGAVTYFAGTWLGAKMFRHSGEIVYRNVAFSLLLGLSIAGLVV